MKKLKSFFTNETVIYALILGVLMGLMWVKISDRYDVMLKGTKYQKPAGR